MDWVEHAIWWQVYPLGFCGAPIRDPEPTPAAALWAGGVTLQRRAVRRVIGDPGRSGHPGRRLRAWIRSGPPSPGGEFGHQLHLDGGVDGQDCHPDGAAHVRGAEDLVEQFGGAVGDLDYKFVCFLMGEKNND